MCWPVHGSRCGIVPCVESFASSAVVKQGLQVANAFFNRSEAKSHAFFFIIISFYFWLRKEEEKLLQPAGKE